jgi:hypothetical protein
VALKTLGGDVLISFSRADGGGVVFVNPEYVVAVTCHNAEDSQSEIYYASDACPIKVSVVLGGAHTVAESLGQVTIAHETRARPLAHEPRPRPPARGPSLSPPPLAASFTPWEMD